VLLLPLSVPRNKNNQLTITYVAATYSSPEEQREPAITTKLSNQFDAIKARLDGSDTQSKGLQQKRKRVGEKKPSEKPSRETLPFANILLADEFCKYSTGDAVPKRFVGVQTRHSFICASKDCGVQRHLDRKTLIVIKNLMCLLCDLIFPPLKPMRSLRPKLPHQRLQPVFPFPNKRESAVGILTSVLHELLHHGYPTPSLTEWNFIKKNKNP
jgi:hypothetical protein